MVSVICLGSSAIRAEGWGEAQVRLILKCNLSSRPEKDLGSKQSLLFGYKQGSLLWHSRGDNPPLRKDLL